MVAGRVFHSFGAALEKLLSAADLNDLEAMCGTVRRVVSRADLKPERAELYGISESVKYTGPSSFIHL